DAVAPPPACDPPSPPAAGRPAPLPPTRCVSRATRPRGRAEPVQLADLLGRLGLALRRLAGAEVAGPLGLGQRRRGLLVQRQRPGRRFLAQHALGPAQRVPAVLS